MLYKVIGVMSGSSLDGIDLVYTQIREQGNRWTYDILYSECVPYAPELAQQLQQAKTLSAEKYFQLHRSVGEYMGSCIQSFIHQNNLEFKVDFVAVHGHTVFHSPEHQFSTQLGCGANIAAQIHLPVIDNLRNMDMAYKGQGAPIVPIGERLLFADTDLFLNIGGIANLSFHQANHIIAFDVCPANAVLNFFAQKAGFLMDEDGHLSQQGIANDALIHALQQHDFFSKSYPKSLSNELGLQLIQQMQTFQAMRIEDQLASYVAFIVEQIYQSLLAIQSKEGVSLQHKKMLLTGGGAYHRFFVSQLQKQLNKFPISLHVATDEVIQFKEALIMALIGVLRWREESNVLKSVSGATQNTVNGSVWYASKNTI